MGHHPMRLGKRLMMKMRRLRRLQGDLMTRMRCLCGESIHIRERQ